MNRKEMLACLTDRPCAVCKYHSDNGCTQWKCVFEEQPCEDAISRSEAIRVASGYCHWVNIPDELAKLPSVNPKPCDDAISRHEVKDLFCRICMDSNLCYRSKETCEDLRLFDTLPSVTPQQKVGMWIETEVMQSGYKGTWIKCNNCGYETALLIQKKYCPNCGAKMEVEE